MLDIFNNDAFTVHSMTEAMALAPFVPMRIGRMGIFNTKHPTTHTVFLERRGDVISLIPSKVRGSGETTKRPATIRDMRPIMLPYVPYDDAVIAADVSGVRAFGENEQVETVSGIINEKLATMRQDHEVTHEWLRIGAIKGIIIDGDGTTVLANLFTEFGLVQSEVDFVFGTDTHNVKQDCIDIIRYTEDVLGGQPYDHIHAFCGNQFWDALIQHPMVLEAYSANTLAKYVIDNQGQGTPGRGTSQLLFNDIIFENYRGGVGDLPFIATGEAHFFPVGTPDLFTQYFGPAMTINDVNTPGKDVYAMQERMKFDAGVEIHTESNPLAICKRPKLLVKGKSTTWPA